MSKEAIMLVIDTGNSMSEPFNSSITRGGLAFQCVRLFLQQKMFNNSNHEVGMIFFGDNDSPDGIIQVAEIEKPKLGLVRNIEALRTLDIKNDLKGGSILEALSFAVNKLNDYVGKKKYTKRIFLFTNGAGDVNRRLLPSLTRDIEKSGVKINLITIDFMEGYDPEVQDMHGMTYTDGQQIQNCQAILELKKTCKDNIQIFPASMAIQLYRQFRRKELNPVALYKGKLQIAPGLYIDVVTYKKTREEKLKTLKRYSKREDFNPDINANKVIKDVVHHVVGDQACEAVQPDEVVEAYQYGPNLVPISKVNSMAMKFLQEKCMKVLGFIHKDKVPRQAFMSSVDMVLPDAEDLYSRKLFSSFVLSMLTLNRYALVRYIPRNNKNGVSPKLMVMIPYKSASKGEYFYLVQLPTSEGIRQYQFNSLPKASETQKDIVAELIDKMNLYSQPMDEEDEPEEMVKPKLTFNPARQYMFQTVFYRIFNEDSVDLPPLDPSISEYLNPEKVFEPKIASVCQSIKSVFNLQKKELKVEKENKKKLIWAEISKKLEEEHSTEPAEEDQMLQLAAGVKKFTFEEDDVEHVDPKQPISTFMKMIKNNKQDLVRRALDEMSAYIRDKHQNSPSAETHLHLLECCKTLREACQTEKEEEYWDEWFFKATLMFTDGFMRLLKEQGVGFLLRDNREIFRATSLTVATNIVVDDLD